MATPAQKPVQPTKVITGKVRFSYAHVFKPEAIEEGQDPKYSCALLIPKTDKATLRKIKEAVDAAKVAGTSSWGGKVPANLKLPLRDGDEERPDDEAYAGMYFLNATSATKPGVVDANLDPIILESDFYSGCYGRASIKFFPFNKAGNKGVAVGLNNLQKMADGENLGSTSTPDEDFGDGTSILDDDDDFLS